MSSIDRLDEIAHRPLVHLAGGPITMVSLATGFLIFVAAYVLAGLAGRGIHRLLDRKDVAHGARFAIAKMVRYVVLLLGATSALTSIGVRLDALLAASTVVLVGLGFGLQNIAQNFVSGLILLVERPVSRGDFVRIGDTLGTVVDIGMRATRVVTRDEVTIIVPNSELVTARVINHSVPTTNLRIAVKVGVAYGTDLDRLRDVLQRVALNDADLLREPAAEVRFDAFGDSSLDFSLLVWIGNPREDLRTASRLRFAIEAAFRAAKIAIPFPQRDVHVHSVPASS
jgi:small-conductance mechanosensitive channel